MDKLKKELKRSIIITQMSDEHLEKVLRNTKVNAGMFVEGGPDIQGTPHHYQAITETDQAWIEILEEEKERRKNL